MDRTTGGQQEEQQEIPETERKRRTDVRDRRMMPASLAPETSSVHAVCYSGDGFSGIRGSCPPVLCLLVCR